MATGLTLVEQMAAAGLTGPSWAAWKSWAKCVDGHGDQLTRDERRIVAACTGDRRPPTERPAEAHVIKGRRCGGTLMAGRVLAVNAAMRKYPQLAPGERAVVGLASADREQARGLYAFATEPFTASTARAWQALLAMVTRRTRWSLDLKNAVTIEIRTSSYGSIRGRTYCLVVADELSFWQAEDGSNPASEVLGAVRPGLVTLGGQLIGVSTPYGKTGALWDLYRGHYGKDDERVFIWQASSRQMNPTIAPAVVDEALARDEESARAEWLGEFRDDATALVTDAALRRVVRTTEPAEETLWPLGGGEPLCFVDAASGSGGDSFTAALAVDVSLDTGRQVHVLEVVEKRPPFDPAVVVQELGDACRELGIRQVHGDAFAKGWLGAMCRGVGLEYRVCPLPRSTLYTELLVLINTGGVSLPNDPRLIAQLMGLIRRPTASGREAVDHSSHTGAHDDVANACAGAAVLVDRAARRQPLRVW
jgi:hypothetical protein